MRLNRIRKHWTTGLAAVLLACTALHASAQEARIAAVNSDRILRDSLPARVAQAKLEKEFSKRDHDRQLMAQRLKTMAEKLDKDGPTLSPIDRANRQRELNDLNNEFLTKQREFRDDLNQRRNEELASILDQANRVIKQIAEKDKYDLIVQEAVYVSPRIDITDQVLRVMNGGTLSPNAASAPSK